MVGVIIQSDSKGVTQLEPTRLNRSEGTALDVQRESVRTGIEETGARRNTRKQQAKMLRDGGKRFHGFHGSEIPTYKLFDLSL